MPGVLDDDFDPPTSVFEAENEMVPSDVIYKIDVVIVQDKWFMDNAFQPGHGCHFTCKCTNLMQNVLSIPLNI